LAPKLKNVDVYMSKNKRKSTHSTVVELSSSQITNAPPPRSFLDCSLFAIDALNQERGYVHALDRICIDLLKTESATQQLVAQYEQRFLVAITGICEGESIPKEPGGFRKQLSAAPHSSVQLASATWIRASLACSIFPVSSEIERDITESVERSFTEVYRRLDLDPKTQSYEKRKAILNNLSTFEKDLSNLLSSPISIRLIGTLRQGLMKLLKSPISQAVLYPFVPEKIRSESRLAQLFQCVSDLAESAPEELMQTFQNASEIVGAFTADADQFGTYYCETVFAALAKLLKQALDDFMLASPLAQPANIDILEVKKKYPLSSAGTTIRMTFQVKNGGLGSAQDVLFRVEEVGADSLHIEKKEWYLGTVSESLVNICVPIFVSEDTPATAITTSVTWRNYDRSEVRREYIFDLEQQRKDIEWDRKKFLDPFSLEPVEDEAELVGRTDVLEELTSLAYAKSVGSCYLYGQKRVGKTSVVKTFLNKLLKSNGPNCPIAIYLERGEFGGTDQLATIQNLGNKLSQKLKECDRRFDHLTPPVLGDTLVPLNTFLEAIHQVAPEFRAIFILDEFDELPIGLYKRTDVGDAFFGSLRSMTSKPSFGLFLVGSENMRHVIHLQGHALNKFQTIELDYFDRKRHWADFQELVRRPVQNVLDVEDDAIVVLYEATYGNPFFTKLICGRLFKTMVNRRDCHVTAIEMQEAIDTALRQDMGINKVQHFWSDGIFEVEAKHEEISLRRRKILLSLAFVARDSLPIDKARVFTMCMEKFGIDESVVDQELADLSTTRKIVRIVSNKIEFLVPFFLRWLIDTGINEIISVSIDADASLRRSREEEQARIRSEEILTVTRNWQGLYKGRQISEDSVRSWLNQFGDTTRQRLAFTILQGLKFYNQAEIRAKVKEAHGIVSRHLVHVIEKGKVKRSDIVVSYLDGPGKSGSRYAKLYADENGIYYSNVIERSQLGSHLRNKSKEIDAVVFIDDVVGSGKSAAENFENIAKDADIMASRDQVKMFFIAICGLDAGIVEMEKRISKLPLQIEVHVCDHLDDKDRVFSDRSRFFLDSAQRHEALALCREIGATLEKRQPLGYGDSQLAIVFEDTVPNNSLPVLWKQRNGWAALFPRD